MNYRYRRSVDRSVRASDLYAAFVPTLLRDALYCVTRGLVSERLAVVGAATILGATASPWGRFARTFLSVSAGALAAAPGNELRAYYLHCRRTRPSMAPLDFLNVPRFLRTSLLGSLSLALVISTGYLVEFEADALVSYFTAPVRIAAPRGVWLVLGTLSVAGVRHRWGPVFRRFYQLPAKFDRYTQQRQLTFLRLAQESNNLVVGLDRPDKGPKEEEEEEQEVCEPVDDPNCEARQRRLKLQGEIIRFVIPACGLVAANQSMTAVDKAFVGRISSTQLAAMGSGATSFDCVSYVTTFVNTASLTLLGAALAKGDTAEANKLRSHALIFAGCLGTVLALTLSTFSCTVCRTLGGAPPGEMLVAAREYLVLRSPGIPIERLISIGTTFCLASKDGATPLRVTAVGSVANVILDWVLCRRYPGQAAGASGAASALAALISGVYLFHRLKQQGLFPRPLVLPRRRDIRPFLSFAGPVFLLLIVKSATFTQMTAYASGLLTNEAAAHQLFVSLLFLTGVAVGTPLSWAAQSFMPESLQPQVEVESDGESGEAKARLKKRVDPVTCLRALLIVAAGCSGLAGVTVMLSLRFGTFLFTRDAEVVAAMLSPGPVVALIVFVILYPMFLVLEGTLIAARKLRLAFALSSLFLGCNASLFYLLRRLHCLSLGALWGASAASLLLAVAASFLVAVRVCDQVPRQESTRSSRVRLLRRP
mmetsp:Transcript_101481/g.326127  ORF Transcript_101481/g.326127 Transcript_101481/m.326127 type:complete len:708 (+) Transcript_101481:751-2874(+)